MAICVLFISFMGSIIGEFKYTTPFEAVVIEEVEEDLADSMGMTTVPEESSTSKLTMSLRGGDSIVSSIGSVK